MTNTMIGFDDDVAVNTGNGGGWKPLEDGDYHFTVKAFRKENYMGSAKIPECNVAVIAFEIDPQHTIENKFYLVERLMWKAGQLFNSLGFEEVNGVYRQHWNDVWGREGNCHIVKKPNNNDPTKFHNEIDMFYPATEDEEEF